MRTTSHRPACTSGGAASSRAATGGAGVPPANDLDSIDPAFLHGCIQSLKGAKRTIIHSTSALADRIPNLLPHLTCTIAGLNEIIAKLVAAFPPEAQP
ncbi:MAG: hypothetical protein IKO01_07005 [Kiritimatiellae bacterium]|nr:hypothetical protein [Kiritimatiellia bacterium]